MKASTETISAIYQVYQQIGFDIPEGLDGEEIIEMCIDANRLDTAGFLTAEIEVHQMVKVLGYDKALKQLAEQLPL